MPEKDKKDKWSLYQLWGGDNRQYRLITNIVTWVGIAVTAYIIFQ